jgi:hypothetical protein
MSDRTGRCCSLQKPTTNKLSKKQGLLLAKESVVVETILNGWAVAQAAATVALHRLAHDVRTRVPENLQGNTMSPQTQQKAKTQ